jgi:hypothetical protein
MTRESVAVGRPWVAAIFLSLFFAGCNKPAPTPAAPPVIDAPAAMTVPTLSGDWRVAGIDGRSLDESYGLALSANDTDIWWAPRCAGAARSYQIDGSRARFGPVAGALRRKPGEPTPPVCAIAPPPRLADVMAALDVADRVVRTPQNGIEISGGGHSLLIFSQ